MRHEPLATGNDRISHSAEFLVHYRLNCRLFRGLRWFQAAATDRWPNIPMTRYKPMIRALLAITATLSGFACLGAAKSSQLMVKPLAPLNFHIVLPAVVVPPTTSTVYITATAYDVNGLESDFSSQLLYVYTNGPDRTVTIQWDPSAGATGYRVYWGGESFHYTNSANAGLTVTYTIQLTAKPAPPPPIYGAVYGQSSSNVGGPFSDLTAEPFYRFTNAPGARLFFRVRIAEGTNAIP